MDDPSSGSVLDIGDIAERRPGVLSPGAVQAAEAFEAVGPQAGRGAPWCPGSTASGTMPARGRGGN